MKFTPTYLKNNKVQKVRFVNSKEERIKKKGQNTTSNLRMSTIGKKEMV